mgnify:CR=1 FL=1
MKYSITAYDKAENELKRRREAVMNEHEVHAQEIAQRLPEIEVLTRSLKANNCELMKGIVGKNIYKKCVKTMPILNVPLKGCLKWEVILKTTLIITITVLNAVIMAIVTE